MAFVLERYFNVVLRSSCKSSSPASSFLKERPLIGRGWDEGKEVRVVMIDMMVPPNYWTDHSTPPPSINLLLSPSRFQAGERHLRKPQEEVSPSDLRASFRTGTRVAEEWIYSKTTLTSRRGAREESRSDGLHTTLGLSKGKRRGRTGKKQAFP